LGKFLNEEGWLTGAVAEHYFIAVLRIRIGSGSRRAKITYKNRKKSIFNFLNCYLLRTEGFSFRLDVLKEGIGKK
jgi:hypothetical protein